MTDVLDRPPIDADSGRQPAELESPSQSGIERQRTVATGREPASGESSPVTEYERRIAEIDQLGDEIAVLASQISAATYELLVRLAEFDRREGWGQQGARSCAEWLAWRTSLDRGAAREKVRVARALEHLKPGHRRADALVLIAESALAAGLDPGTRGDRYQVVLHVDAQVLADHADPGVSALGDGQRVLVGTRRGSSPRRSLGNPLRGFPKEAAETSQRVSCATAAPVEQAISALSDGRRVSAETSRLVA
jgi:Domain of unknown function (DUF222)